MTRLRILLIGVNDYLHPRPTKVRPRTRLAGKGVGQVKTRLVDADLPGARMDVANMYEMLNSLAPRLDYDEITGVALTGQKDTERQVILDRLAWLAASAAKGDQLLLYFSGHSAWVRKTAARIAHEAGSRRSTADVRAGRPRVRYETVGLEVALCPSDTSWSDGFVTSADVLSLMREARKQKACLEIILETCSAGGIAPKYGALPRNYFGQGTPLNDRLLVRWDAAKLDESSHSAVVPACKGRDIQGLFTRFLCDALKSGGTRSEVLQRAKLALARYWKDREGCACPGPVAFEQTPQLQGGENQSALSGSCVGAHEFGVSTKQIDWQYVS